MTTPKQTERQHAEETHARWAAEHIAANPTTKFNDKYLALAASFNPEPLPEFLQ